MVWHSIGHRRSLPFFQRNYPKPLSLYDADKIYKLYYHFPSFPNTACLPTLPSGNALL